MTALHLRIPVIRGPFLQRDLALKERDNLAAKLAAAEGVSAEMFGLRQAKAEDRLIVTDYAYRPRRRPIETTAGGRGLIDRLKAGESNYVRTVRGIARHAAALSQIPVEQTAPDLPFWQNDWFPPFDGVSLYGLIAETAPARYIEVGSGNSTLFARQAIRDAGTATRIISIDPHPRADVDAICDEVIRRPLEDVPSDFWETIGAGDILFMDSSHRSFQNSDVTVFFVEIAPALRAGAIWGLHDILLPFDYPEEWQDRFYNEQYVLLAYLLGGAQQDEIILPVAWATSQPQIHGIVDPLWRNTDLFRRTGKHGSCFWMRRR